MSRVVEPSVKETAFSCPHCGAFTTQNWHQLRALHCQREQPLPFIPSGTDKERLLRGISADKTKKANEFLDKLMTGLVFFDNLEPRYLEAGVCNLHLSKCYNCAKISVWVHDHLLFPAHKSGPPPN